MRAFWNGVKQEGWPQSGGDEHALKLTLKDRGALPFSENSFAALSEEYMILSLRFGYHFATVEALCSDNINKNYINLQFSHGGSTFDRRARRVSLMTTILREMEFECRTKGDFLEATVSYKDAEAMVSKLTRLGRLTIMTKQLDMALSTDQVASWYLNDFLKRLDLVEVPTPADRPEKGCD
jgi:pyruvate,water dikinase